MKILVINVKLKYPTKFCPKRMILQGKKEDFIMKIFDSNIGKPQFKINKNVWSIGKIIDYDLVNFEVAKGAHCPVSATSPSRKFLNKQR